MSTITERHNLPVKGTVFNAVESLSRKEDRSITNMAEVLLKEALKGRGVKV